jgi:dipeptidyl aminopeptidase/acylaminoacyl peptidase
MDSEITFTSDGLRLAGSLHVPDSRGPDQRLPALIVLHGFIGAKDNSYSEVVSRLMESWGYVVLRIDFRGCGKSEGTRGYVLCHDQVADTRNAMTWLAQRPEVDPARIAVLGHSFGAAIAAYTASTDTRFAAAIISFGWGHGERKFRGQHPRASNSCDGV